MNKQILLTAAVILLSGCDQSPITRHYQEVFIEADSSAGKVHATAPGAGQMPQDAIHAGLDPSTMPQDAIHAGLLSGSMPQDAIHAGLDMSNIPDDAIHAGLKSGSPNPSAESGPASSAAAMAAMPVTPELERSVDRSPLQWQTPPGWTEKKGGGMRLVTFTTSSRAGSTETTIISLGGQAGGLEANVTRWMRQINLSAGQADLQRFLAGQEKLTTASGLPTTMVDFTGLQADLPGDAPSMIAAVMDRGRSQIFVKMSGPKAAVTEQRAAFRNLVTSISEQ